MNSSESIVGLAKALAKAQAAMAGALKDAINPHLKSKYADLASVVDAVRPALAPHGLSFIQVCHEWDIGAQVETIILHESGEWLSCGKVSVPAMKADAQGFGSALTYARRYGLSAAFGVAPEDDDGHAATRNPPKPEPVKTITETQVADLDALITEVGADKVAFLKFAKLERLADMKFADYEKAIAALNKKREVAA